MVSTTPSIAKSGLKLALDGKQQLQVFVDGALVKGVPDRLDILRAAYGQVEDIPLTEIFDQGEVELRERIGSARLVLVRSQEIDEALESDKTAAGWRYIKELKSLISRAVARLAQAGVGRMVVASDHGFLILSRKLGPDRVIDPPGGQGELHRRCWVGKGGSTTASTARIPLAELGGEGELDLIVPRGLAIFSTGGARRFFHGGLSPQEWVIPVLDIRTKVSAGVYPVIAKVEVVGQKIMTGIFSATVELQQNLFSETVSARVVPHRLGEADEVARIRGGEGYDETTGVIRLAGGQSQLLTFQVVSNLKKGELVVLDLLAAETDRLMVRSKEFKVAADVRVKEDGG